MDRTDGRTAARVQVYFEDPELETALRREARAARVPMSRAAEQAIRRGLVRRPYADPEDRLLALERALRDHMRAMARDMTIVQELLVEFARAFFARLPDTPADADPLLRAAVEARIARMLDETAHRIAGGGRTRPADEASADEASADRAAPRGPEPEPRSFQPAE